MCFDTIRSFYKVALHLLTARDLSNPYLCPVPSKQYITHRGCGSFSSLLPPTLFSAQLAVTAAAYADFAKGFALFSLVLAPPSFAKEFMDGFPFLGPCCDHYFQDETEETRVLKGHVFWVLSTAVTTVVNHQIGLTACDLAKFPRPGWLAYPQVEVGQKGGTLGGLE